ncbi:DUF4879 domain-containing protein [Pseudomonas sp. H11T01]|uniref:DUF4879 domain-containing protein n=1 Tax=Pseudomonas sp. H11T01 TaxID=3402749 RepID=UPI003ACBD8F3
MKSRFNGISVIAGLWVAMAALMGAQTAAAASAPPLSEVKILKVQSPACGYEDVADGRKQTQCNHGAGTIRVFVLEQGYGRNPTVALDGFVVNGTKTRVCGDGGNGLGECSGSAKIVGYLYVFDLVGKQEGTFTFRNTSINAPGNTMSAQIYIK